MSRLTLREIPSRLHRATTLLVVAALLAGCSHGRPSQVIIADPETLQKTEHSCFAAAQVGAITAVTPPRPGDELRLSLWSGGMQSDDDLNTYPPLTASFNVRLRTVAHGRRLHSEEQRLLATFLQVNRAPGWLDSGDPPMDGVTYAERQSLAAALEGREAEVWNAFVGSLCVGVADVYPPVPGRKAIVVQADLGAMCAALRGARDVFAGAFLQEAPCRAGRPGSLTGVTDELARSSWASAALDANAASAGSYYYADNNLRSPVALVGEVVYGSVRPFFRDAPDWSLAEWENAGICLESGQALKIKALRLRGSSQSYRILEPEQGSNAEPEATHDVRIVKARRELVTHTKQSLRWSLPLSALDRLTVRDVDEIIWAAERIPSSRASRPEGCFRPERS